MSHTTFSFYFAPVNKDKSSGVSCMQSRAGFGGVCACLCVHTGVCILQPFSPGSGNIGILASQHHQMGYKYLVLELIFSSDRIKKKKINKNLIKV